MAYKQESNTIALFLLSSLFIGHLFFGLGTAKGIEIFVNPDGNDNWTGRLAQANNENTDGPLATLTAAQTAIRKVGADQQRRIVLRAGEYFLEKPLVLNAEDNGVVITAAEGERVVLYGGRKISGWHKDGKWFWAANLPGVKEGIWDFRVLIVNGRYCQRARLPEKGKFLHLSEFKVPWMSTTGGGWKRKPTQQELTTLKYKPEDVPQTLEPRNAEVRVYHMWDESLVGLSSIDRKNHILHFSTPSGHPPGAFGVKNYVIYNIREGMTQPGQWYLDRKEGKVVYWPLPGEDMAQATVLTPTVESIIQIQGDRNKPVNNITLQGLKLAVTTTPLKAGGFGAGRFAGAVQVNNARDCRLDNLEIYNAGGQGIRAEGSKIEITHCHVHHTGACGIKAPSCIVTDNHVHDIGLTYPSSIALWGGGKDGVFSHNEIHDAPYTGINCGGENHRIEANHIYRVMQKLHDGGGIYCFAGKNTVLRGNFIHDVIDTGGYGSSAYYLDERSEQCIVEKNLSVNVARPSHNHMAHHNTIRNNVFIHDGDMRLTFPKCSDFRFLKNVLYATGKITINGTNVLTDFRGNILYSKKGEVIGQTINNYSTTDSKPLKPDENNCFDDPHILEFQNGHVKFHPDSPTKKIGITEIDVSPAGPRKPKNPMSQYEVESMLDIMPAWSGHPVGFCLLTHGDDQFVAFYDDQRQMTVAARKLDSSQWQFVRLPEKVGWDSHNYITMTVDDEGYLHLSGNMHCVPLVYFRTAKPLDITTFKRMKHMTGKFENRCTYPRFFRGPNRELIFTYRDGSSGNGNQIYNIYDLKSQTWRPLLDKPLTDGQGKRNAYLRGPTLGPDGFYHLVWVWRDTPDCSTNHDLSYARSKDLIHWETSSGQSLKLPITLDTAEIIDPVPVKGGMINGNTAIGFDLEDRVVISYHKFDDNGNTQIYNARRENGSWKIHQASNWNYRWYFSGGGSISFEIKVKPIRKLATKTGQQLVQDYTHRKYGSGAWILDDKKLNIKGKWQTARLYPRLLYKVESNHSGMQVNQRGDLGESRNQGINYLLRWETLGRNRDRAHKGPLPEPSMLRLYKMRKR